MRRLAMICGMLMTTSVVVRAGTPPMNLMVSGQSDIAIVDANENGNLGDEDDCIFGAQIAGTGQITVTATQSDSSPNLLRACLGPCTGFGALDSSAAMATITGCDWSDDPPSGPFVPACMELGPSVPSSSSSSCNNFTASAVGASQGDPNGVLQISAGRLFYPGFEFLIPDPGFGFVCNAGGPAVEISTISGRRVITDFMLMGNPPTHACVNMPFQLVDGSFKLLDACVPLTMSGNIEYAVGGGDPFAVTPLSNGLPACGGSNAAPAASDLALVMMALTLMAVGAWALGRRGTFSASLPL